MKGSSGARECAPLGVAFPEATLSVRRREALAEAIDLVHDRYWSDLEQLGYEDASLSDLRLWIEQVDYWDDELNRARRFESVCWAS